ncbi:MAG: hypothetical protein MUP98_20055 [Candidatus Aminicenantes bacterium]|nr:hypothetical protein [Candidatus Aminicenantes bacterium]
MYKFALRKFSGFTVFLFVLLLSLSSASSMNIETTGEGNPLTIDIEVSPYIINIESNRFGEIRIFTNLSYSFYMTDGVSISIYINDSGPILNIRPTRDSWGNLILKFDLSELEKLDLATNATNAVNVVVMMRNGDEYIGWGDAYISTKKIP